MNNKCIKCGLCERVCIGAIELGENGPKIDLEKCYACGHCVAVCPVDAIDNPRSPAQEEILPKPDYDKLTNYLRSVRSIREFKKEDVAEEKLLKLLDIGRYPQTGKNSQGISYALLSGREKVEELLGIYIEEALKLDKTNSEFRGIYAVGRAAKRRTDDLIFRGAPAIIAALADRDFERGRENAQFSLTFISLAAPTLGLGTCWAGFFEDMACRDELSLPIRSYLKVPEGKMIRGVLMCGVPDVEYRRLVYREPLDAYIV